MWGRQWIDGPGDPPIGGRYDPVANRWTAMARTGTNYIARSNAKAVWTGREMIIWGGRWFGGASTVDDGVAYNPTLDEWRSLSTSGAPRGGVDEAMIWTGRQMIVWGGTVNDQGPTNLGVQVGDGARYDPELDSWTPISSIGAPSPRAAMAAVWTGSRLLVWGGARIEGTTDSPLVMGLQDGAAYDPEADEWSPISSTALIDSTATWRVSFWTGGEMLVWDNYPNGGAYDPIQDSWRSFSIEGAPKTAGPAAWTGSQLLLGPTDAAGHVYDLAHDTWTLMPTEGQPSPRSNACSVWTGSELIVWGGIRHVRDYAPDGGRWTP